MKLSDEFEDKNSKDRLPVMYMAIGVVAFISIVFVIVICMNYEEKPHNSATITDLLTQQDEKQETEQNDPILDELGVGQSTLTSDQLDFWNMYKEDEKKENSDALTKEEKIEKNAQELMKEEEENQEEEDLSEGGTKTKVTRPDGSEQWIMINAYINKNDYKEEGFVFEDPVMKYYYQGEKQSTMGVVLDDSYGYIDFNKLKKDGVDFVILRVGYRGYETGFITMDEMFDEYEQKANDAGLKVGAYFESQAVTVEEADEEAQMVVGALMERSITYPVAMKLGVVLNDTSRTDDMTKSQITEITNRFCEGVENAGYSGIVFGSKYWLLRRLDLTLLGKHDIWLSQEEDTPDYPYEFAVWQYKNGANLDGLSKEAAVCISFVDYSKR